jgi:hypothetical protein
VHESYEFCRIGDRGHPFQHCGIVLGGDVVLDERTEQAALAAVHSVHPGYRDAGFDRDVADLRLKISAPAALSVPWAAHGATLPLIEPLAVQFGPRALVKFGEHGLVPSAAFAYVDPWPHSLLRSTDRYPAPVCLSARNHARAKDGC